MGCGNLGYVGYPVVRVHCAMTVRTSRCSSSRFNEQKEHSPGGVTMLIAICRQAILKIAESRQKPFHFNHAHHFGNGDDDDFGFGGIEKFLPQLFAPGWNTSSPCRRRNRD